jgi:hypothetical protein
LEKREPSAVDLDTAFHHQRPGNQDAMRMRQRAVALITRQMFDACAQRLPPDQRVTSIALMAVVETIGNLGNMLAHERGIAAETIARQHERLATEHFNGPVRPADPDCRNLVALIHIKRRHMRSGDNRDLRRLDSSQQSRLQPRAGLLGHRVHPVTRMAGIEEIIEHDPLKPVRIGQPFQRWPDCLRGEPGQRCG